MDGRNSSLFDYVQMDEKARQRKRADERSGIIDVTDDPYQPYPSPSHSEFWSNDLFTDDEKPSGGKSRPFNPSHLRKRVGRGGRIYIDRHVTRSEYKPLFKKKKESDVEEWSSFDNKWKFDHSDSELTDVETLMQDDAKYAS